MKSVNFSKFIENRIANIKSSDSFAFAAATGLGPWVCPLAPSIVFGYAFYVSAPADMAEFRMITAVGIAIGLIVAGAISSHNAIASGGPGPWSLTFGYISLEIIGLWLMSVSFDIKVAGTVASLFTLIVYLSRSMAKEIDTAKDEANEISRLKLDYQMEQARLDADHRRELAAKAATLKHDEKMARIEAKKVSASVSATVPEVSHKKDAVTLKSEIINELGQEKPNMTRLAQRLDIGRGTLYRHLGTLAGTGEIVKNGKGYKLP